MLKRLSLISLILFGLACVFAPDASAQANGVKPIKNKVVTGNKNKKKDKKKDSKRPAVKKGKKQQKDLIGYERDFVWVDLGLPSGTKWATCNVGAYDEAEIGNYYAWGELQEKASYSHDTYTHSAESQDNISGIKAYDVARSEWGGKWCMPSKEDFDELRSFTTAEWTNLDGQLGLKLTSNKNDMFIFLPATGYKMKSMTSDKNFGAYWTSTRRDNGAYCVIIDATNKLGENAYPGFAGFCVRPVLK